MAAQKNKMSISPPSVPTMRGLAEVMFDGMHAQLTLISQVQ
jgi:hypothetical protein